jgi:hypothetical protein
MPSRVRIFSRSTSNSAKVARMLKKIFPRGSAGSWIVPPRESLMPRLASHDVAGIGDRAGEPVELGHHEGVARPDGGQGLVHAEMGHG